MRFIALIAAGVLFVAGCSGNQDKAEPISGDIYCAETGAAVEIIVRPVADDNTLGEPVASSIGTYTMGPAGHHPFQTPAVPAGIVALVINCNDNQGQFDTDQRGEIGSIYCKPEKEKRMNCAASNWERGKLEITW